MTDAAEAAFSPPTPPSRCSRRAPCPRPHVRSPPVPYPRRWRVPASPPPRSFRRASGLGRAPAGSGRGRHRVGAAADWRAASPRDPRPPRREPARFGIVTAEEMSEGVFGGQSENCQDTLPGEFNVNRRL
ncbi:serine/arginine repetitive matrix protein 1-like [Pteronotus mesoamericanus]|uniref:serine/arginine repetitive matrix protein 1-like n=1 Tax=Pteronotus mesoamericanus TaxID=1884717 RepID=UPI0023EDE91B|nr:serine/arginine repetitive matrix protein 1-like [Pteronotus parnellii mesoamericanus]